MDPQVGASFIPKTSLVGKESKGGGTLSLFLLLALLLFVASVAAAGASFAYGEYLKSSIVSKDESLKRAEGAFDPTVIRDLVRLDGRMTETERLIGKHVAPSAVFSFLASVALERVQFTSFDYKLNDDGSAKIELSGIADSFSSVALQSDQFSASKVVRDVIFSGVTTNTAGRVVFSVSASVDPSFFLYSKNLGIGQQGASVPQNP